MVERGLEIAAAGMRNVQALDLSTTLQVQEQQGHWLGVAWPRPSAPELWMVSQWASATLEVRRGSTDVVVAEGPRLSWRLGPGLHCLVVERKHGTGTGGWCQPNSGYFGVKNTDRGGEDQLSSKWLPWSGVGWGAQVLQMEQLCVCVGAAHTGFPRPPFPRMSA